MLQVTTRCFSEVRIYLHYGTSQVSTVLLMATVLLYNTEWYFSIGSVLCSQIKIHSREPGLHTISVGIVSNYPNDFFMKRQVDLSAYVQATCIQLTIFFSLKVRLVSSNTKKLSSQVNLHFTQLFSFSNVTVSAKNKRLFQWSSPAVVNFVCWCAYS